MKKSETIKYKEMLKSLELFFKNQIAFRDFLTEFGFKCTILDEKDLNGDPIYKLQYEREIKVLSKKEFESFQQSVADYTVFALEETRKQGEVKK